MKFRKQSLIRILCAIGSGILLSLGFPTLAFFYIAPFALIPLFSLLFNLKEPRAVRSAIFYIWIFGFIFQLRAFFWVSQPIVYFSGLPEFVGYTLFVFVSSLTAFYFVFLFSPLLLNVWLQNKNLDPVVKPRDEVRNGLSSRSLTTGPSIPIFFLAIFITSLEIIIPRVFDWTLGQIFNHIYFSQLSSLFGFNTGTFFIIFTNLTLAFAITQYRNVELVKKTLVMNTAIWTGIFIFGFMRVSYVDKQLEQSKKIRVAFIQPNFTFQELASKRIHATNAQEISLKAVIDMSAMVVAKSLAYDNKRPDLLIWPESVSPDTILFNPVLQNEVAAYSASWQVPILLQDSIWKRNSPQDTYYSVRSMSKILTANGFNTDSYEKWFPIPFGEAVPFESVFPSLGKFYRSIIRNSSKVEAGTSYEALNVDNKFNVAPLICFDSIYQRLPFLQTKFGHADLFVNQANFMWMVDSIAGLVFGYLDKARAIENARSMIMAANTGPTIAFDPVGRIIWGPSALMSSDSGFVDVPIYNGKTLFSYVYYWPILLCALFGIYKLILRFRSRSS